MRPLRSIVLLQFVATLGLGQAVHPSKTTGSPDRPIALVRNMYQQVVARHPGGIPQGEDMKVFEPFVSNALLYRMNVFLACNADWNRQYWDPDEPVKPPYEGVWESGIFSGGDERTAPGWFHIERTALEKDGSLRVFVRLTWHDSSPYRSWEVWHVVAVVVREGSRFAVDDVIYLKDKDRPDETDRRLSRSLSQDCDGPRWVGRASYKPVPMKPLRQRVMWVR